MKRTAILLAFAAALGTASCKKSDNTEVTQPANVAYNYSFHDDFNTDANGWIYTDPTQSATVAVVDKDLNFQYHPLTTTHNLTVTVDPAFDTKNDFAIQTFLQSDNAMGIAFGATKTNLGYAFELDNNGNYGLFNEGDSLHARNAILNWTKTTSAKPGYQNKLEITQVRGEWYGYVNDKQVFSVTARPIAASTVGFVVEANTNGVATYIDVKWD